MLDELHLPTADEVARARASITGVVRRTPLWRIESGRPGVNLFVKLEALQPYGSFKIRAATHALAMREDEARQAGGVLAPSAGNFGQGLAAAARRLGVRCTIVAPDSAARTKIAALEALGATVIRVPFDAWWAVMTERRMEGVEGAFFHPVADNHVVAGNATIADEILDEMPAPDAVIVPFGGGGLVSGIGSVMRRLSPRTRVVAVEAETSQPLAAALAAGRPVKSAHTPSFVDGIGSTGVLAEMWPLVRACVDGNTAVSLDEIAAAIRLLMKTQHVLAEGAGAAPLAAALAGTAGTGNIVCVISGGNIDSGVLSQILINGAGPD